MYNVWFRHSGEYPPDDWSHKPTKQYTLDEIRSQVDGYTITHMVIEGSIPDDIHTIAPHLHHLMLRDITTPSNLSLLSQLTQLEVLNMSDNEFSEGLPEVVSSLTSLKELYIGKCGVKALPDSLSQLTQLEVLNMSDNKFSEGLPEVISSLTSLKKFVVWECGLKALPASFSQLTQLEVLNMNDNEFSEGLPEVVSSLTTLKQLYIQRCRLLTLSDSLSQLTQLEVLNISDNEFSEGLPEVVSSLTSLKQLYIQRCRLLTLSDSLSQLTQLEVLNMSDNKFSEGLPEVVSSFTSLRKFYISECGFKTLPQSLSQLTQLEVLNMSDNEFSEGLPEVVSSLTSLKELYIPRCSLSTLSDSFNKLANLQFLDMSANDSLKDLGSSILELSNLKCLYTAGCTALVCPPYEVCGRGLSAVRQYYVDLHKGQGEVLPLVTIAVIGNTMAGKTSLITTLQNENRRRVLTDRGPHSDEATRVFEMKTMKVDNVDLRLIDMGGQQIYHIAYQLTLRENCIPLLVVNMQQYGEISTQSGSREAVRRLGFDWLACLYLANPGIGPPTLVFTHKDKFDHETFSRLKIAFVITANELRDEILSEVQRFDDGIPKIQHFLSCQNFFLPKNIYEIGKDDNYKVYDSLKSSIFETSQTFVSVLPTLWKDVNNQVLKLSTAFSTVDDIFNKMVIELGSDIAKDQIQIILAYMHDCGHILWYNDIDSLKSYVFHRIKEVTKLLEVLFDHRNSIWEKLQNTLQSACSLHAKGLNHVDFESFVSVFHSTGFINELLLENLIKTKTAFSKDSDVAIAVTLFQQFYLLFGPLTLLSQKGFIVPYFSPGYLDNCLNLNHDFKLHLEIMFVGLPVPHYVYQQMSIVVLKMFPDDISSVNVKRNGVKVFSGGVWVLLVHDSLSRKLEINVSSAVEQVPHAWSLLVDATRNISREVQKAWPACKMVHKSTCSHCLLKDDPHPNKLVSPSWCYDFGSTDTHSFFGKGMLSVLCGEDEIPSLFVHPCKSLSEIEIEKLKKVVETFRKEKFHQSMEEDAQEELVTNSVTLRPPTLEDELSDISDDDDYMAPANDPEKELVLLGQRVVPTKKKIIQQLYHNTDKVYRMTKNRGRALIINNKTFDRNPERLGSEVDIENLEDMLHDFKFNVTLWNDLTAENMLHVIYHELQDKRHEDCGVFWLCILSHGTDTNYIYGSDGVPVNLRDIYDLLSPPNFPGMAGKPKVVMIQACSGAKVDLGKKMVQDEKALTPSESTAAPGESTAAPGESTAAPGESTAAPGESIATQHKGRATLTKPLTERALAELNYDDLLVMKSSFDTYASRRHPTYGSLMVRCLVYTMYKHACHRDMEEIFKIVQQRIREFSIKKGIPSGQSAVITNTLTHRRKLYLFPRFDGLKPKQ